MKNIETRVKLTVNLNYSVIICFIIATAMIALLILPFVFFPPTNKAFEIVWIIAFSVFSAIGFINGILSYQTATLDENGITFRSAIKEIAKVKWRDIVKIDIKDLSTLHSTLRTFDMKWIVLYTANHQVARHGGGNIKNKPPWQIKYTPKNVNVLAEFCKKYRTDLDIKELLSELQKKK